MASEQSEFWSTIAPRYDQVVDAQIGPATRSMVREHVAREGPLGRVVEFGCGTGFFTDVLAGKAERLVATDVAPGMVQLAERRVQATNVSFQVEDCQQSSFADGCFDTAFISLVLHFTEPARTVREMHRLLRGGGTLLVVNLDPGGLTGLDRVRAGVRILVRGILGYRVKPPAGFGRNVLTERQLADLLTSSGFRVTSTETVHDPSRSSHIPLEYVRAERL